MSVIFDTGKCKARLSGNFEKAQRALDAQVLKDSTCAQAESYAVHGEDDQDFQNISLGAFSISGGGKKNQNSYVCDNALKHLYMTIS